MRKGPAASVLAMIAVTGAVLVGALPARSHTPCPPGMAAVGSDLCIDRYEASLVEVHEDGKETPWSPYLPPDGTVVRAVSVGGVIPQGYISQVQAGRACARAGKRLCTEHEWFSACRGPHRQTYGYGDTRVQGRCNENHRWHPVVRLFGDSGRFLWGMQQMNDPQLNQLPGTLALTGAHAGCANETGVYDMVGNLHEWTADPLGTFRGGYYMDTTQNGEGCWYRTAAHNVAYHDYSTGFRCCATAD